MYWVIFLNNKGPLMFINTTQVNTDFKTGNNSYDSRITKRKKLDNHKELNKEVVFIDKDKLMNVISLYSYDMPVVCSFKLEDREVIGIPTELNNSELNVLVDNNNVKLDLSKVKEFTIVEF